MYIYIYIYVYIYIFSIDRLPNFIECYSNLTFYQEYPLVATSPRFLFHCLLMVFNDSKFITGTVRAN